MGVARDSAAFCERHYSRLQDLALAWLHGDKDQADEAVQDAFRIALEKPDEIPFDDDGAERWLVRVLKYRVLRVMSRTRLRTDRPRARFTFCPKREKGETGSGKHYLAQSAEELSDDAGEYDSFLAELSVAERELLFCNMTADWQEQRQQAEFRELLRTRIQTVSFTPRSRMLQFVCEYASPRSIEDYLSTFRVLERRFGKPLRLADLTSEFYDRYVTHLSRGTRRRVDSLWNIAARMGLANKPPQRRGTLIVDHPAYWSHSKCQQYLERALRLSGNVYRTSVPQREYWPSMVYLAGDGRLAHTALLSLTWPEVKSNADLLAKLRPQTIELLERLEGSSPETCFPWNAPRHLFHKYYARALRQCGVCDYLTPRERDVLIGTARGYSEAELASQFGCCIATVRQYRLRIREKLGLTADTSLKTMALAARQRGWLPAGISVESADDRVYRTVSRGKLNGP
jgi:DNA-binding CsgD family transcriptional regulator